MMLTMHKFFTMELNYYLNKREELFVKCPNLLEWTSWRTFFCRLRYEKPDILTSFELREYCKSENYINCNFFLKQACREQFEGGI